MNHNEEHEHNHEEMEEVIISFTDENDVEHQYALIEELSVGEALLEEKEAWEALLEAEDDEEEEE